MPKITSIATEVEDIFGYISGCLFKLLCMNSGEDFRELEVKMLPCFSPLQKSS